MKSPIFLVQNKDKTHRLVCDLRRANTAISNDYNFSIPRVDFVLNALRGNEYFTKLDIKAAYYGIEVDEDSRDLLTIISHTRVLRFTRLPMGLSISGFVFQNVINSVLAKHLYKTVVGYVDDLTSFGVDWETALTNTEEILKVLKSYNFRLNTSKCLSLIHKLRS